MGNRPYSAIFETLTVDHRHSDTNTKQTMSASPDVHHLDGQRSPKRRKLDIDENDGSRYTTSTSLNPTHQDTPTSSRKPSWSSVTNAPTPIQNEELDIGNLEATDTTFLNAPRPLPRQRLQSVEQPSVTPGLESTSLSVTPLAEPREQQGFISATPQVKIRPSQSPSSSTNRSATPPTQDGYREHASSPVPSHSTALDPEPEQQHKHVSPVNYRPHLILRGHKRAIAAVRFSPDGKWIASCCKLFQLLLFLISHITLPITFEHPTGIHLTFSSSLRRHRPHLLCHNRPAHTHPPRPPRWHLLPRLVSRLPHSRHRL